MAVDELKDRISRLNWRDTLILTSTLASAVCNGGGVFSTEAVENTFDALETARPQSAEAVELVRASRDPAFRSRPIVHQEGLSLFQAMVILWASEEGQSPTAAEVSALLLATADHLDSWAEPDSRQLTQLEHVMADVVHVSRFNWQRDVCASIVRAVHFFSEIPLRGHFSTPEAWSALQFKALGCHLDRFVLRFSLPITLLSTTWGRRDSAGRIVLPTVDVMALFSGTLLDNGESKTDFARLCSTREAIQKDLTRSSRSDGLPDAPRIFYKTPFVFLNETTVVALSPWAIREQLHTGMWARFRGAVQDSRQWLATFGDVFELWARRVATSAATSKTFSGRVIISAAPGSEDEIEDVVVQGNNAVVLFSVKASLVAEDASKAHLSRSLVVDWYERFLFAKADENNREHKAAGALRLLDKKITNIRLGKTDLPADIFILPVVVCFDDLCENAPLTRWIELRCKVHHLLPQDRVAPVSLMTADEFDGLMALAARGIGVVETLRLKATEEWHEQNMDALLDRRCPRQGDLRSSRIAADYQTMTVEAWQRLFGRDPPESAINRISSHSHDRKGPAASRHSSRGRSKRKR